MFVAVGARDQLIQNRTESFAIEYVAPMIRAAQQLGLSREELLAAIEKELS